MQRGKRKARECSENAKRKHSKSSNGSLGRAENEQLKNSDVEAVTLFEVVSMGRSAMQVHPSRSALLQITSLGGHKVFLGHIKFIIWMFGLFFARLWWMTGLMPIRLTETQHCSISSASLSSVQDAKATVLSFIIQYHFKIALTAKMDSFDGLGSFLVV